MNFSPFRTCKTPLVFGVFSSIVYRLHCGKSNVPNVYIYNRLHPIDCKTNRFVYGLAVVRAGHEIEVINSCQTEELISSRSNAKSLNSLGRPSGSNWFRLFAFLSPSLPPSFPAGRCWCGPPNGPSFAPAICTKTVSPFPVRIPLVATLLRSKIALNVFTYEAIDLLFFGWHHLAFVVGRDVSKCKGGIVLNERRIVTCIPRPVPRRLSYYTFLNTAESHRLVRGFAPSL